MSYTKKCGRWLRCGYYTAFETPLKVISFHFSRVNTGYNCKFIQMIFIVRTQNVTKHYRLTRFSLTYFFSSLSS